MHRSTLPATFLATIVVALAAISAPAQQAGENAVTLSIPLDVQTAEGAQSTCGVLRFFDSVSRPDADTGHIAIEAEDFSDAVWTEASQATAVSERWIQDVLERGKANLVDDASASGGTFVKRADKLVFPFELPKREKYTVWIRLRPAAGWFGMSFDGGKRIARMAGRHKSIDRKALKPDDWYWQPVANLTFGEGMHLLELAMHPVLQVDKIVFAPAEADRNPEGEGPAATPRGRPERGRVTFEPFAPKPGMTMTRLAWSNLADVGRAQAEVSRDGGKTWQTLPESGVLPEGGNTPVQARLTLTLDDEGRAPVVDIPRVVIAAPRSNWPQLAGGGARYTFDAARGVLSGIELIEPSHVTMMPPGTEAPGFRIKLLPEGKPDAEQWLEFADFNLVDRRMQPGQVVFGFRHKALPLEVETRYTVLDSGLLNCDIDVVNDTAIDVNHIEFLHLDKMQIGQTALDDNLIWPVGTGRIVNRRTMGKMKIGWPKAAVGYFDLYDDTAGLYVGMHERELLASTMAVDLTPNKAWVTATLGKNDRVRPHGGRRSYRVTVGAHSGDWHSGADLYKAWFDAHFDAPQWPEWFAESDGWLFGNATFDAGTPAHFENYTFTFRRAMRYGFRHVQFWGSNWHNGGGGQVYYPPPPMGGHEGFAAANKWWKDRGGVVGYYMFPNGVNEWVHWPGHTEYFGVPWSEIPAWGRPPGWDEGESWDWLIRNDWYGPDRKPHQPRKTKWKEWKETDFWKELNAPPARSVWMCPLSEEWLSWYKHWVVHRYAGQFHTLSSYSDTLHLGGAGQVYSPYYGFWGEGTIGQRRNRLCKEIMLEARQYDKRYLPVMEMQCDAYGMYMAYMIGSSAIDSEMLLYTHPEHAAFEGSTGAGAWGRKRLKRYGSFWMYGTRVDHRHYESWASAIVNMRKWITRWVNDGRFMDDLGMTIANPRVRGKLRRVMTDEGTRGFVATFWHRERYDYYPENDSLRGKTYKPTRVTIDLAPMAEVDDTGTRPEDWIPRRAFLIDTIGAPRPIEFTVGKNDKGTPTVAFDLPPRWVNGVVFVNEARGAHSALARIDQVDFKRLDVTLVNLRGEPLEGRIIADAVADSVMKGARAVELVEESKTFRAAPGKVTTVSFPYRDGRPPQTTQLVLVDILADGATRNLRAAAYDFMDDPQCELTASGHHETDIRTGAERNDVASVGRVNMVFEPDTKYRLTFKVRGREDGGEGRLRFNPMYWSPLNSLEGVQLRFARPFEYAKGEWTEVSFTFRTPRPFFEAGLDVQPGEEKLDLDAFQLETLPDDAKVDHEPKYMPVPEAGPRGG